MPPSKKKLRAILAGEEFKSFDQMMEELAGRPKPRLTPSGKDEVRFVSSTRIGKADRLGIVLEEDPAVMGDIGIYYGVRFFNPNRGAAWFGLKDAGDLDKLEAAFKEACADARAALTRIEKEKADWRHDAMEANKKREREEGKTAAHPYLTVRWLQEKAIGAKVTAVGDGFKIEYANPRQAQGVANNLRMDLGRKNNITVDGATISVTPK